MSSVRDVFFNNIYEMVNQGEEIYVITADLGAPSLDAFRRDYPEKYISVGIAEQNLISVAVGMALTGKKVIAYGLNPFPITRAYDQIRCLMAELNVPITVCVLNAGLCSAECGYTHMPVEDIGMLRMLSNIEIYNPTDEVISQNIARDTLTCNKPRIIRFDKTLNEKIYPSKYDLESGFGILGEKEAAKVCVVSNGCYIKELRNAFEQNDNYKSVKLIDLYRIPFDEKLLLEEIKKCENIITVEENVRACGLGSLMLEIL